MATVRSEPITLKKLLVVMALIAAALLAMGYAAGLAGLTARHHEPEARLHR
jgi:hypothetical protein